MPARSNRVTVALTRGGHTISWDAREALMERCKFVHSTARIRAAFGAVGATRAVTLSPGQRAVLLAVLEGWAFEQSDQPMPVELRELRVALIKDLHDTARLGR